MNKKFYFGFTLAEGATHVTSLPTKAKGPHRTGYIATNQGEIPQLMRSAGFTLEEVLITLGIIGVVAAITIPNMITNYQKRVWVAQLQKSYATLNQGFKRMLADDNVSALSETETFNSIGGDEIEGTDNKYKACTRLDDINSDACAEFYKNFAKYFKVAEIRKLTEQDKYKVTRLNKIVAFNPYTDTAIMLMDGTLIWYPNFYSNSYNGTDKDLSGRVGGFNFDVNGLKGPNIVGRDIFVLHVGNNGNVYARGSRATASYSEDMDKYWKTSTNNGYSCYNNIKNITGQGCGARVLEEGKMNY